MPKRSWQAAQATVHPMQSRNPATVMTQKAIRSMSSPPLSELAGTRPATSWLKNLPALLALIPRPVAAELGPGKTVPLRTGDEPDFRIATGGEIPARPLAAGSASKLGFAVPPK